MATADQAKRNIVRAIRAPLNVTEKALSALGLELHGAMLEELSKPGSGRVYGNHQASAPGEPPAADTALYKGSWQWYVQGDTLYVGTSDSRGPWLEFGTSQMLPRPHLRPVMHRAEPRIPAFLARFVAAETQKTGGSS